MAGTVPTLRGISEIRAYFRTNQTPIYFVSPTAFNLLGIDRWLRQLLLRQLLRLVRGQPPARLRRRRERPHARVRVDGGRLQLPARAQGPRLDACPRTAAARPCSSCSTTRPRRRRRRPGWRSPIRRRSCATGSTRRSSPRSSATRPACRARRTTLGRAAELRRAGGARRLGRPRRRPRRADALRRLRARPRSSSAGSATGTSTPRTWPTQELKVMKRINNRAAAVEAVLTRHGTIVGPLMTDLTGYPELTPHKGGWCGNDIFPDGAVGRAPRERAGADPEARRPASRSRATAASSRSTTSSTSTPASSTSARSTRASAA